MLSAADYKFDVGQKIKYAPMPIDNHDARGQIIGRDPWRGVYFVQFPKELTMLGQGFVDEKYILDV